MLQEKGKNIKFLYPKQDKQNYKICIDKNGILVPIQSNISTSKINNPATKINPIPKPQRIKDIQKNLYRI